MASAPGRVARAVVFVTSRPGPALKRRERCLDLAGIPFTLEPERRPSGTFLKLCVAEEHAVDAYAALGLGGCTRAPRPPQPDPMSESIAQVASMLRDEAGIAADKLAEALRVAAPRLFEILRAAANRG